METTPQAQFSFIDFRVNSFDFKVPKVEGTILGVGFKPSGIFFPKERKFELTINAIVVNDDNKKDVYINLNLTADFKFENVNKIEDIPAFFFVNSIPIVFPYVRAFVSNLSLQANWEPMIIPLLNMTHLADKLRENTTEASESDGTPEISKT